MDITMEQIYAGMQRLSEGQLAQSQNMQKLGETLAIQGQMLSQIMQSQNQHTQLSAQQGAQIAALITETSVLKNEISTRNLEIASLQSWRSEMPTQYIPRKEHEAQNHTAQIVDLRKDIDALEKDVLEHQKVAFSNVIQWGLTILSIVVTISIFALTYFRH